MNTTIRDLWICQDCTMLNANGELGQGDEVAERAHADAMVEHLGDDTMGLVLDSCAEHEGEDCDCARKDFSSRQCDGCGSILAGYRHRAAIIR